MVYFHTTLKGEESLLNFTNSKEEKTDLTELLAALQVDTIGTLEIEDTKKIKTLKAPVFEIRKNNLRIFYIQSKEDICLIHISRKQKNKTEKKDLKILKKRLQDFL